MSTSVPPTEFCWTPQPAAAAVVHETLESFVDNNSFARQLRDRLLNETGTRLADWVDHFTLPDDGALKQCLIDSGFAPSHADDETFWRNGQGVFPVFRIRHGSTFQMVLHVDSVADFLFAHEAGTSSNIEGSPFDPVRRAPVSVESEYEVHVLERHGSQACDAQCGDAGLDVPRLLEVFRLRRRRFERPADGFDHVRELIESTSRQFGTGLVCDLFFQAEREYWQSRNQAACLQKSRQDAFGLGWGNHDHHTYRSGRGHFTHLVSVLEALGFVCRERFYAGREAGWGAQVLEQPECQIVVFADVDLSPDEIAGDFAHNPLPPGKEPGTVGLWCHLHGESFLEAGMHHLECQFDFDQARRQLGDCGIETMQPFTDLPHLRQAFTQGEIWPVDSLRIEAALREGLITPGQAEKFQSSGALGSHLELLERNEGYKGFNQSGINDIILQTDPRTASRPPGSATQKTSPP